MTPRATSVLTPEQELLLNAALDVHGALTGPDLRELGLSRDQAQASGLITLQPTVIGPLGFPREVYTLSLNTNGKVPRRSAGNSIDSAYLRLYLSTLAHPWSNPAPQALGVLQKDRAQMASTALMGHRYVIAGRVLGGGFSPNRVRDYLRVNEIPLVREGVRLMVLTPSARRFRHIEQRFTPLLIAVEFTPDAALTLNTE